MAVTGSTHYNLGLWQLNDIPFAELTDQLPDGSTNTTGYALNENWKSMDTLIWNIHEGLEMNLQAGSKPFAGTYGQWVFDDTGAGEKVLKIEGIEAIDLVAITERIATEAYVQQYAQGLDWQNSVLDKDLVTSPAPVIGARYIIAGIGGAWSGGTINDIAECTDDSPEAWDFVTPNQGYACQVEDESTNYNYNGAAWVKMASIYNHNDLANIFGNAEGYHLSAADYGELIDANAQLADLHTDGDPQFNSVTADHIGDGSALTGIDDIEMPAKVNEAGGITKGDPVYISGATGQFPQVSIADNTDTAKEHMVGIANETKTDSQNIVIMIVGTISGLNTAAIGADGDPLYLGAGTIVNTEPTAGAIVQFGHISYSHASQGKITSHQEHNHNFGATLGEDFFYRLGDNAGVNKFIWKDYANSEVASVDSNGDAIFNQINFSDNKKIILGDGDDIEIYSDGSKTILEGREIIHQYPNLPIFELYNTAPADTAGRGHEIRFAGLGLTQPKHTMASILVSHDGNGDNRYSKMRFEVTESDVLAYEFLRFSGANREAVFNNNSQPINFRFVGDNDDNLLFVDGVNDKIGIGLGSNLQAKLHIADTTNQLVIEDTDGAADEKYWLVKNDGGILDFAIANDAWSAWQSAIRINRTGMVLDSVVINDDNHACDFRVEGDTDPNLFFVDGGNDRVGIGLNSNLQGKFHIAATNDQLIIEDTDGPVDEKYMIIKQDVGSFEMTIANDAWNSFINMMKVTRTGMTIDTVEFSNGNFGIGGAPSDKLHVIEAASLSIRIDAQATGRTAQILCDRGGANLSYMGPSSGGTLDFWTAENIPFKLGLNNGQAVYIDPDGRMAIGTGTPATDAKLDIQGTDGALMVPRMTTAQRNALTGANGMILYNTTDNKFQGYENGSWNDMI